MTRPVSLRLCFFLLLLRVHSCCCDNKDDADMFARHNNYVQECLPALVEADTDSDDRVTLDEYGLFAELLGLPFLPSLPLVLLGKFNILACLCSQLPGEPVDCCVYPQTPHISVQHARENLEGYLDRVCFLTSRGIDAVLSSRATPAPSTQPTTVMPSSTPTITPTITPSNKLTVAPSLAPTTMPSLVPTERMTTLFPSTMIPPLAEMAVLENGFLIALRDGLVLFPGDYQSEIRLAVNQLANQVFLSQQRQQQQGRRRRHLQTSSGVHSVLSPTRINRTLATDCPTNTTFINPTTDLCLNILTATSVITLQNVVVRDLENTIQSSIDNGLLQRILNANSNNQTRIIVLSVLELDDGLPPNNTNEEELLVVDQRITTAVVVVVLSILVASIVAVVVKRTKLLELEEGELFKSVYKFHYSPSVVGDDENMDEDDDEIDKDVYNKSHDDEDGSSDYCTIVMDDNKLDDPLRRIRPFDLSTPSSTKRTRFSLVEPRIRSPEEMTGGSERIPTTRRHSSIDTFRSAISLDDDRTKRKRSSVLRPPRYISSYDAYYVPGGEQHAMAILEDEEQPSAIGNQESTSTTASELSLSSHSPATGQARENNSTTDSEFSPSSHYRAMGQQDDDAAVSQGIIAGLVVAQGVGDYFSDQEDSAATKEDDDTTVQSGKIKDDSESSTASNNNIHTQNDEAISFSDAPSTSSITHYISSSASSSAPSTRRSLPDELHLTPPRSLRSRVTREGLSLSPHDNNELAIPLDTPLTNFASSERAQQQQPSLSSNVVVPSSLLPRSKMNAPSLTAQQEEESAALLGLGAAATLGVATEFTDDEQSTVYSAREPGEEDETGIPYTVREDDKEEEEEYVTRISRVVQKQSSENDAVVRGVRAGVAAALSAVARRRFPVEEVETATSSSNLSVTREMEKLLTEYEEAPSTASYETNASLAVEIETPLVRQSWEQVVGERHHQESEDVQKLHQELEEEAVIARRAWDEILKKDKQKERFEKSDWAIERTLSALQRAEQRPASLSSSSSSSTTVRASKKTKMFLQQSRATPTPTPVPVATPTTPVQHQQQERSSGEVSEGSMSRAGVWSVLSKDVNEDALVNMESSEWAIARSISVLNKAQNSLSRSSSLMLAAVPTSGSSSASSSLASVDTDTDIR